MGDLELLKMGLRWGWLYLCFVMPAKTDLSPKGKGWNFIAPTMNCCWSLGGSFILNLSKMRVSPIPLLMEFRGCKGVIGVPGSESGRKTLPPNRGVMDAKGFCSRISFFLSWLVRASSLTFSVLSASSWNHSCYRAYSAVILSAGSSVINFITRSLAVKDISCHCLSLSWYSHFVFFSKISFGVLPLKSGRPVKMT